MQVTLFIEFQNKQLKTDGTYNVILAIPLLAHSVHKYMTNSIQIAWESINNDLKSSENRNNIKIMCLLLRELIKYWHRISGCLFYELLSGQSFAFNGAWHYCTQRINTQQIKNTC